MHNEPSEVLSALVDGESVDPAELSVALAAPGAVEALVDFTRFRAELRSERVEPSSELHPALLGLASRESMARSRNLRRVALAAAAMMLLGLGVAAGWMLRPAEIREKVAAPPEVTREEPFVAGVDWHSRS